MTAPEPDMMIESLENPNKQVSIDKIDTVPDALPLLENEIGDKGIESEEQA
jgi:hypothetical protein